MINLTQRSSLEHRLHYFIMSTDDGRSLRFVLPVFFSFALGMYAGVVLSGRLWCDLAWEE